MSKDKGTPQHEQAVFVFLSQYGSYHTDRHTAAMLLLLQHPEAANLIDILHDIPEQTLFLFLDTAVNLNFDQQTDLLRDFFGIYNIFRRLPVEAGTVNNWDAIIDLLLYERPYDVLRILGAATDEFIEGILTEVGNLGPDGLDEMLNRLLAADTLLQRVPEANRVQTDLEQLMLILHYRANQYHVREIFENVPAEVMIHLIRRFTVLGIDQYDNFLRNINAVYRIFRQLDVEEREVRYWNVVVENLGVIGHIGLVPVPQMMRQTTNFLQVRADDLDMERVPPGLENEEETRVVHAEVLQAHRGDTQVIEQLFQRLPREYRTEENRETLIAVFNNEDADRYRIREILLDVLNEIMMHLLRRMTILAPEQYGDFLRDVYTVYDIFRRLPVGNQVVQNWNHFVNELELEEELGFINIDDNDEGQIQDVELYHEDTIPHTLNLDYLVTPENDAICAHIRAMLKDLSEETVEHIIRNFLTLDVEQRNVYLEHIQDIYEVFLEYHEDRRTIAHWDEIARNFGVNPFNDVEDNTYNTVLNHGITPEEHTIHLQVEHYEPTLTGVTLHHAVGSMC